jgi:hypothetical protein
MTLQTRKVARLAAAEAAASVTASAHAVLFSLDLWLEPWPWMDRDSKAALRGVSIAMRRLVDGSCTWPRVELLPHELPSHPRRTLQAVGDASDLSPLATTSLARLTSLTVRQVGRWGTPRAPPFAWAGAWPGMLSACCARRSPRMPLQVQVQPRATRA